MPTAIKNNCPQDAANCPLYAAPLSNYMHNMGFDLYVDDSSTRAAMTCSFNSAQFCDWQRIDTAVYYRMNMGINDWQRPKFLQRSSDSTFVAFSQPARPQWTIPANTNGALPYGTHAGSTIILHYSGFGHLGGVPGACLDADTYAEVACTGNARFVPAFTIPDGTAVTIGSSTKYIRAMETEVRFGSAAGGVTSTSEGITFATTSDLPAAKSVASDRADTVDPSNPANDVYIGPFVASVFEGSPGVIHGAPQS